MTDYARIDFSPLTELARDEVVTHALVRDIPLPGDRVLALVTLDNGRDHRRPNTLGPAGLTELGSVLDALALRAGRGEIAAVAVTGKPYILAAGADLSQAAAIPDRDTARLMAQLGHHVLGKLAALGVPSFCFVNGLALGGGLEIALHCTYRTVDSSASGIGLPEVFLGIVPGWGGAYLLPNLIGIENALTVVIENPLRNNRLLKAADALELGIVDAMVGSATFLEESIRWATRVLDGEQKVPRPNVPGTIERTVKWPVAIQVARRRLEQRIGTVPRSPSAALGLLEAARKGDAEAGFAREDETLAELLTGDQFRASIYAFDLVSKRAKHPVGAPDASLARRVTKVGVIGAGLMARQFALLFVRRLMVPVVITDLDRERVEAGVAWIHGEIDALADKGRLSSDDRNRLCALVTGTTDRAGFADCDWVIEAVFEELGVKREVLADVERHLAPEAVLATNTSSLSVAAIGEALAHPERLVGFHFFNPVAVMPLVEVVDAPATDDATLATAVAVAGILKKTAVIARDAPGFVVNRVLAKVLGEAMRAAEEGAALTSVDDALRPLGLPMTAFELLELVGLTVGAHVLDTHHAAFPDRFRASRALHRLAQNGRILERDGKGRVSGVDAGARRILEEERVPDVPVPGEDEILTRVQLGLADEIHRMLEDDVVHAAEDVDLALILGAGYPFGDGGITPYLDRVGASERAFGATFHDPVIRGVG